MDYNKEVDKMLNQIEIIELRDTIDFLYWWIEEEEKMKKEKEIEALKAEIEKLLKEIENLKAENELLSFW